MTTLEKLDMEERLRAKRDAERLEEAKRKVAANPGLYNPQPPLAPTHPKGASFLPAGVNTGKTWSGGGESSGPVTPNNLP